MTVCIILCVMVTCLNTLFNPGDLFQCHLWSWWPISLSTLIMVTYFSILSHHGDPMTPVPWWPTSQSRLVIGYFNNPWFCMNWSTDIQHLPSIKQPHLQTSSTSHPSNSHTYRHPTPPIHQTATIKPDRLHPTTDSVIHLSEDTAKE